MGKTITNKKTNPKRSDNRKAAAVKVVPSAAMKRDYKRLAAAIAKASRAEMVDFDARWEAAAAIVEHSPPLYLAAGFASIGEFYRTVMREEPRQAERFILVAKFATPAEEERFGVSKLGAAIAFVTAKIGKLPDHPPLPIAFDRLRIPVGKATKSLASATVADIRAATTKLTGNSKPRQTSEAHKAITRTLATVASLHDVDVAEKDGFLTFHRVPTAALEHFIRALSRAHAALG